MPTTWSWVLGRRTGSPRWAPRSPTHRWRQRAIAAGLVGAVSAGLLFLRYHVPIPIALSSVDDELFLRTAQSITRGNWLGRFDQLTLVKGSGYSFFIAFCHSVGLPLKIGEQLTYLLAGACIAGCVALLTRRLWPPTVAYMVFVANPAHLSQPAAEILRDDWWGACATIFIAASFIAAHCAVARCSAWLIAPPAVLAGAAGAVMWLTREESITVVPAVAVIIIGLVFLGVPRGDDIARLRSRWVTATRVALSLVLLGATFVIPVNAVSQKNQTQYGVDLTTDFASGTFPRAYADWTRVENGAQSPDNPYNPIPRLSRRAVYAISPAARELRPYLEDPRSPWNMLSCDYTDRCDGPGLFMTWAIRDAAAAARQFGSAPRAQIYFAGLSEEIDAACQSGALVCAPRLPSSVQPLTRASMGAYASSVASMLVTVGLGRQMYTQRLHPVTAPDEKWREVSALVGGVPSSRAGAEAAQTWFRDHRWLYQPLIALYAVGLPVLLLAVLVGIGLSVRTSSNPSIRMARWLTLGFGIAVLARIAALALLDAADYPSDVTRYHLATQSFLVGFMIAGGTAVYLSWGHTTQSRPRLSRLSVAVLGRRMVRTEVPGPSELVQADTPDEQQSAEDHGREGAAEKPHDGSVDGVVGKRRADHQPDQPDQPAGRDAQMIT